MRVIAIDPMASDPAVVHDIAWHALESSRCKLIEANLGERSHQLVTILSIALEGLKYMTRWFLRCASTVRRVRRQSCGKLPPLCDLVSPRHSPAVAVCQYYSYLMTGEAPRLKLLWARSHNSFEEWAAANPELNFVFRRACQCASSWTHFFFVSKVLCMPWLAASLIDYRQSAENRSSLRQQVWKLADAEEQIDDWFGVPFLKLAGSEAALDSAECRHAIFLWAWEVLGTVAPCEFMHGRNKRRANRSHNWASFVAQSLNNEATARLRWQHAASNSIVAPGGGKRRNGGTGACLGGSAAVTAVRASKKAKSLHDIAKQEGIESRRSRGYAVNITSEAFAQAVRERKADIMRDPRLRRQYELDVDQQTVRARAAQAHSAESLDHAGESVAIVPCNGLPRRPEDFTGEPGGECNVATRGRRGPSRCSSDCYPLEADALERILSKKIVRGVREGPSYTSLEQDFFKVHNDFSACSGGSQHALSKPRQPRWMATPAGLHEERLRLEASLQRHLAECCAPHKMKDIAFARLLLKCTASHAAGSTVSFFVAAAGNAQAGQTPFRCHLIRCTIVSEEGDDPVVVQIDREHRVASEWPLPFGGAHTRGMMAHHTYWDVAAVLLAQNPTRIEICKIKHDLLGSDRFVLAGQDLSVQPLVFETDPEQQPEPGDSDPNGVDWDSGIVPKKPKSAGKTKTPRGPAATGATESLAFGESLAHLHEEIGASVDVDVAELVEDARVFDARSQNPKPV